MTISYKQTEVYFQVFGEGETLVLLHGFLENGEIWKPFLDEFSKMNQVVVVDLFGHGKTGKAGEIHSMEEMAKAVAEILKYLNSGSAKFLGHSMGGYVALAFAEFFPEKTKALYLLNSTSEADSEVRKNERNRSIELLRQNKDAFIRMAIGNLFAPETREMFEKEVENLIENAQKIPVENIVASIEGMKARKDRSSILKKFKGRKILFAGKRDSIIPFEKTGQVAKNTGTRLIPFSGGHMGFVENRELFLAEMKGLLE